MTSLIGKLKQQRAEYAEAYDRALEDQSNLRTWLDDLDIAIAALSPTPPEAPGQVDAGSAEIEIPEGFYKWPPQVMMAPSTTLEFWWSDGKRFVAFADRDWTEPADAYRAIASLQPEPQESGTAGEAEFMALPGAKIHGAPGVTHGFSGYPHDLTEITHVDLFLTDGSRRDNTIAGLWVHTFHEGHVRAYRIIDEPSSDGVRTEADSPSTEHERAEALAQLQSDHALPPAADDVDDASEFAESDEPVQVSRMCVGCLVEEGLVHEADCPVLADERAAEMRDEAERAAAIELTADVWTQGELDALDAKAADDVPPVALAGQWVSDREYPALDDTMQDEREQPVQTEPDGYAPVTRATDPDADFWARGMTEQKPERKYNPFNIFGGKKLEEV